MIKAIIIDDEMHCVESLKMILEAECPGVQVLEGCVSAKAGLEAIKKHQPDLVFLDIEMPVMNGFQLLEKLPATPFSIIFTTSYDQYAIRAIRFSALDYLLKPIDTKELVSAIAKVEQGRHQPMAEQFQLLMQHLSQQEKQFKKIAVPTAEGFELIPAEEIVRCEANDNYTFLFLKNKERVVACRTLKEVEEQLQHFPVFVRVHHASLINLNEVIRYVRGEGGYVTMSDGSVVNVSRRRKEVLMKWL